MQLISFSCFLLKFQQTPVKVFILLLIHTQFLVLCNGGGGVGGGGILVCVCVCVLKPIRYIR